MTTDSILPYLFVWGDKRFTDHAQPKDWKELARLIQVEGLSPHHLEDRAFRKRHRITLGFETPSYGAPFFELDIVTLKDGSKAYVQYNGPDDFVAIDENQEEHPWYDVDSRTSMTNYHLKKDLFDRLFPNVKE